MASFLKKNLTTCYIIFLYTKQDSVINHCNKDFRYLTKTSSNGYLLLKLFLSELLSKSDDNNIVNIYLNCKKQPETISPIAIQCNQLFVSMVSVDESTVVLKLMYLKNFSLSLKFTTSFYLRPTWVIICNGLKFYTIKFVYKVFILHEFLKFLKPKNF